MKNLMRLLLNVAVWALAVLAILLFPAAVTLACFVLGFGNFYPTAGHPDITFVKIYVYGVRESADDTRHTNVRAFYTSPGAKRIVQELINAGQTDKDTWPTWWHERRKFPMAKAYVTFVYPFHWNVSARAHIYLVPDGVLMLLYEHHSPYGTSYCDYYFLQGRRAAACRRLFRPLFSPKLRQVSRGHEVHLSF